MVAEHDYPNALIAEYETAHDAYLHHSSLQWEIGGLLEAGVFVFWGFLLEVTPANQRMWVAASWLIWALMSYWLVYAYQVRAIYLFKLDRIIEIERELSLEQNRRFVATERTSKHYKHPWPSGHVLNSSIYVTAISGAPLLAWSTGNGSRWLFALLGAAAATLIYVLVNDRRVIRQVDSLRPDAAAAERS